MEDSAEYFDYVYLDGTISSLVEDIGTTPNGEYNEGKAIAVVFFIVIFFMIVCIALVIFILIVLPLQILLINPLEIGIRRFFARNLREQANIREICYTFDHSYKNCVKIQFFRGWYIFLWSLLLVIPGIIKSYEYKMIPYLLGEYPDISMEEAFAQSFCAGLLFSGMVYFKWTDIWNFKYLLCGTLCLSDQGSALSEIKSKAHRAV